MLNLSVYKGEKIEYDFTIKDSNGNLIDLSTVDVKFRVWSELPPIYGNLIFSVDATDEAADGTCKVILTDTQTDIEPKLYFYELYLSYPAGEEYVAEVGLFYIKTRLEGTEGKTFITPDLVKTKIRLEDESYTDEEIQYFIEVAHRKVIADCGNYVKHNYYAHYPTTDKTYWLPHGEILSFIRIKINGEEIDESNYTIDYEKGKITFSSSMDIYYNDFIEFEYIPMLYKDLELLYAAIEILRQQYIYTQSDVIKAKLDDFKEEAKKTIHRISSKDFIGSVPDFGFRGRYRQVSM